MTHPIIRAERIDDIDAIRYINDQAFNQPQESNVIEILRRTDTHLLSLVAEIKTRIIGHILFSPVTIDEHPEIKNGMGLAPMAVLPEYQKQGIGKKLVNTGIDILREQSAPFIIVLGHADYYPKFGFETASIYGLKCQWEGVPDNAFMVLILDKERMEKVKGIVRYREEWNEAI